MDTDSREEYVLRRRENTVKIFPDPSAPPTSLSFFLPNNSSSFLSFRPYNLVKSNVTSIPDFGI